MFSKSQRGELAGHAAEMMAAALEIDDADVRRVIVRLARGIERETKVANWIADAELLAGFTPPTYRIACKADRLKAKCKRFREVGFSPLLILSIISLVIQIVRLWKEWHRKENA